MKTRMFTSIMLSTLFYTTLLSTTFIMPLVLSSHDDAGVAVAARSSGTEATKQVWERSTEATEARAMEEGPLDIRTKVEMHRALRFPQLDLPGADPAAGQMPVDKSGPDAAMVKPGKLRAKTIKA